MNIVFFFLSVVTENMNNTNEINILTNQAWSTHPENPSTHSGEIWSSRLQETASKREG